MQSLHTSNTIDSRGICIEAHRITCVLQKLKSEIANFGKEQSKHIAAAKTKLKNARSQGDAAKATLKQKQAVCTDLAAHKEAAQSERDTLNEQVQAAVKTVEGKPASALHDGYFLPNQRVISIDVLHVDYTLQVKSAKTAC